MCEFEECVWGGGLIDTESINNNEEQKKKKKKKSGGEIDLEVNNWIYVGRAVYAAECLHVINAGTVRK